jgi:hypothetical protein
MYVLFLDKVMAAVFFSRPLGKIPLASFSLSIDHTANTIAFEQIDLEIQRKEADLIKLYFLRIQFIGALLLEGTL